MSSIVVQSNSQVQLPSTSGGGPQMPVITKPASLAAGDLMLVFFLTQQGSVQPANMDLPAGWTLLQQAGAVGAAFDVMYKVADAGDAAATNFTFTNQTSGAGHAVSIVGAMYRITSEDTIVPILASSKTATGTGSGTGITSATITPGQEPMLILFTGGTNASTPRTVSGQAIANNNPSWTEDFDFVNSGTMASIAGAHASWGFATATGAASATFSGSQDVSFACLIALRPVVLRPTIITATASLIAPAATIIKYSATIISATVTLINPVVSVILHKWNNTFPKHDADWSDTTKH